MSQIRKPGKPLEFVIDGFRPDTLPMGRLAGYMADLAKLLGSEPGVHFDKVKEGSAKLVHYVDEEVRPEVEHRLRLVKRGDADADAQAAVAAINQKLAEDGKTAYLKQGRGKLLTFNGHVAPAPKKPVYGPITQPGTLEGKLIRLGGRDDTKPVHLQDGDEVHICNANSAVAKRLAQYYEQQIRVTGNGRWSRNEDGSWALEYFNITDVEELKDESLSVVIERLRQIPGNGWLKLADPLEELERIREGAPIN